MKVAVGADHYGYPLKLVVVRWLAEHGYEAVDVGCDSITPDEKLCDYADAVCGAIHQGKAERGVLICGTGAAMCIRANRWPKIRAVLCRGGKDASGARKNSDMNVMVMSGFHTSAFLAEHLMEGFMQGEFEALERRVRRIAQLDAPVGV